MQPVGKTHTKKHGTGVGVGCGQTEECVGAPKLRAFVDAMEGGVGAKQIVSCEKLINRIKPSHDENALNGKKNLFKIDMFIGKVKKLNKT